MDNIGKRDKLNRNELQKSLEQERENRNEIQKSFEEERENRYVEDERTINFMKFISDKFTKLTQKDENQKQMVQSDRTDETMNVVKRDIDELKTDMNHIKNLLCQILDQQKKSHHSETVTQAKTRDKD